MMVVLVKAIFNIGKRGPVFLAANINYATVNVKEMN